MLTRKGKKNGTSRSSHMYMMHVWKKICRLDLNSLRQSIINAVAAVLDRDHTAAAAVRDHGDLLTRITAEREKERIQLLIIRSDILDDIFYAFLGFL